MTQEETPPQPKEEPSTKLIMIVDDDDMIVEYLTTLLQKEGFRTKSAMDGKIAMKRVQEEKTDLILLDMMMPNESGYETIKHLQVDESTRTIPIFIVSAKKIDRTTWELIRNEPNVKEVITKPINPFNFRQLIHKTLHTISAEEKREMEAHKAAEQEQGKPSEWEMPPAFRNRKVDE